MYIANSKFIAISYASHFIMNKNYIFIQTILINGDEYELYKINSSDYYILGCFVIKQESTKLGIIDEMKFACIANIHLKKVPDSTNIYDVIDFNVSENGHDVKSALYNALSTRNLILRD